MEDTEDLDNRYAREREHSSRRSSTDSATDRASKLTVQWWATYEVLKASGKVTTWYDYTNFRKKDNVFHANILHEWCRHASSSYFVQDIGKDDTS